MKEFWGHIFNILGTVLGIGLYLAIAYFLRNLGVNFFLSIFLAIIIELIIVFFLFIVGSLIFSKFNKNEENKKPTFQTTIDKEIEEELNRQQQ